MIKQSLPRYGLAIATTVTALFLMLALDPVIHLTQASFLLFFGAVIITALYGGRNPAIVATLLSAIFASYFFLIPQFSWTLDLPSTVRMLLFAIQGLFISILVGALRQTQEQAQRSLKQLQVSELEIRKLNEELRQQVDDLTLTEHILKSSEERLRVALKNAPITVLNQDQNLIYTWIYNPTFDRKVEEVLGKRDRDLVSPEDAVLLDRIKGQVLATGTGTREEVKLTVDGQVYYYDLTVEPLQNDRGDVIGVTCAAIDITERQQAESALRQSEQRFRRLVESNLFGVAFSKASGEIYYANDYFLTMVGYTQDDVAAGHIRWFDMTPPEFLPLDEQAERELQQAGVATPFEKEYIRRDGSRVPVLIGVALPEEPSFQGQETICFYIDLSDRKQVEAEREQLLARERSARSEAEAANRVKDEFLTVLSHELRSPLNPILGWARLLQSKQLEEAKVTEALRTIERNARLQAELIDDLLDVSRILRGKLSLTIGSVDLGATIQAAIETVRLAAEAKSIQIETQLAKDVGSVLGDSSRLQQIVWNLLSNAVKFTPDGGRVTVQLQRSGAQAHITVQDTGKGITPDFLPHVFEYFRQADSTITRKFGGLGLGLAIVRHLVELHGGSIQAESPGEDQGATFTVYLPLIPNPSHPDTPGTQPPPRPNIAGVKALVVDDDLDSRELVACILEQENATVLSASSAPAALMALIQFHPDIILSDIGMPDLDGYTFIQKVRSLPSGQGGQIPAIALTAYAGDSDQQQALNAGFHAHLSKPIDPATLIRAIADLVYRIPKP